MGYTKQEIESLLRPLKRLLIDIKCNSEQIAENTSPAVLSTQEVDVNPS